MNQNNCEWSQLNIPVEFVSFYKENIFTEAMRLKMNFQLHQEEIVYVDAEYEEFLFYEQSITQFMEQNTDHIVRDSGIFKSDKPVYEAFCVAEE